MSLHPPPPPGSETTIPSEDFSHIPPPSGEEHVNDVLERKKKFSWKHFGGDGFVVSVAFHVLLAIIALFYIVSKYTEPKKNTDPEVFATGAGGGSNGDKPKAFEQKLQTRQVNVKMPARITSKGASSISLPDTPQTATASFASGLTSGGLSKGFGGGSGGGEGTGIGIGKGGARNFVSLFGGRGLSNNRLTGYIYDFTKNRDGTPSPNARRFAASNCPWLDDMVVKFTREGWPTSALEKYYRGPAQLGVHQIMIPCTKDTAAPEAFDAVGKMNTGAWIAVYKGRVRAPESGDIRFCGTADNYIGVRFSGETVLLFGSGPAQKAYSPRKRTGLRVPVAFGKWVSVTKGQWYDIEMLIGDAGGVFSALLYYERKTEPGKKYVFHTEDIPWGDVLKMDDGHFFHGSVRDLPRDLEANSPVWLCKSATASPVR